MRPRPLPAALVALCSLAFPAAAEEAPAQDGGDDTKKPFELYWKEGETVFKTDGFQLSFNNRVQFRFTDFHPDDGTQIPGTASAMNSVSSSFFSRLM